MKNHLICSAIAYVLQLYISIIYNLCIEPIPFIYLYCFYFPPSNKQLLECIVLNKSLFISFFYKCKFLFLGFFENGVLHLICTATTYVLQFCISIIYNLCIEPIPLIYLYSLYFPLLISNCLNALF